MLGADVKGALNFSHGLRRVVELAGAGFTLDVDASGDSGAFEVLKRPTRLLLLLLLLLLLPPPPPDCADVGISGSESHTIDTSLSVSAMATVELERRGYESEE